VVFCPPGAEWHYAFGLYPSFGFAGQEYVNETIKYIGDSIIGSDTVKKVSHLRFYTSCNDNVPSPPVKLTLFKQKGDTIFFKNSRTQNGWEIFCNFACTPGQSWQITVLTWNGATTLGYLVDSVSYTTVNGASLKRLHFSDGRSVTERFIDYTFLFNYPGYVGCDGDYQPFILCYQDNQFGTKQFSNRGCNFENLTGIPQPSEQVKINLYPNPVTSRLMLESSPDLDELIISFTNLSGREVKRVKPEGKIIEVSDLKPGMYFVTLSSKGQLVYRTKLVKE
jgi:hypothetical protein